MSQKQVRDLMSSEVTTLGRNDRLAEADRLMQLGRIRHLPVLDEEGHLAGIVSQRDLFFGALVRALGFGSAAKDKTLESLRVKECMTEHVVIIDPDASALDAARLMLEHKIGCLPVLAGDALVGIVTESDIVADYVTIAG